MRHRLPLILSATALLVVLLGVTPLGEAARNAIPAFARNSGAVNGIKASRVARPGYLVALNAAGKFPASVGQVGPQGPAGATGSAGPTGATGAAGPAGPAGASGWQILTTDSGASSSSSQGQNVDCPSGKKALGGGGGILNPASHENVALDFVGPSSDGTGWVVQAHEVNSSSASWVIRVYVICATVTT